jgi:hypothetical protein
MLFLLPCPDRECGAPAEILDTIVLASTGGPVRHVKVQCLRRHVFLMPTSTTESVPAQETTEPLPRQPPDPGNQRRSDTGLHW